VADGEPDIRGWTVYASTGRELGTVRDLLVDTDAGEVVMLDVDLRRGDRHTLAPIRAAWIDHATRRVVLDAREAERALAGGDAAAAVPAAATGDAGPADDADAVPALPRTGTLSDDEVRRFNDDYARAYGARGVERGAELPTAPRRGGAALRRRARAALLGPRAAADRQP
jgi:sporulation protein YlmC with PRC-barrel domain